MSLDIGAALREGARRTVARNGLLLMGVFLVFGLANTVIAQSLTRANIEFVRGLSEMPGPLGAAGVPELSGTASTPFALPLGLGAAFALTAVAAVLAEAIRIVSVRALVSERTDTVPAEFVTRNIAWATINGVVGGIVVGVAVVIGLVLLLVPGIFLALSFFFVRQEIAVEDENFVDAMAGSWALTSGDRIELLALAIVVVVVGLLASVPGVALAFVDPALTAVAGVAISAVTTVFGIAVAARAYDQLRAERETRREEGVTPAGEDSEFDFEV